MQTTHYHTRSTFLSPATAFILTLLAALGLVWGVGAAYYNPVLLAPSMTTLVDSKFDSGSFTAAPGSPVTVGNRPASVAMADFNLDGKSDFATANLIGNNVSVLLGNGSGGFTPATGSPVSVGTTPTFVIAADFNAAPTPTQTPSCVTPPSGMTNWWPGNGNTNDIRGSNHGTLQNGATFATGKVGQAFNFDGVDDFVSFGTTAGNFGAADFTIDFWLRTTSSRPEGLLGKRPTCNHDNFWDIRIGSGVNAGKLFFEMEQDTLGTNENEFFSNATINDGQFHHIAYVRSGPTVRLYVDGVLDSSNTIANTTIINNTALLRAGRSTCTGLDGTNHFTGQLDEIEFFSRALSQAEIQSIVNAGSAGKCPCGLVLTPVSQNVASCGGTGTFNVETQLGCGWTAVSNDAFISITSGASGTGMGTVGFTVAANPAAARVGTITVGNQTFTVMQAANTAPTISNCPGNQTVNTAPGACAASVNYSTPTANDDCPGVTVVCNPPSGSSFPKGVTTVTCTATDSGGLTASCSFTVTVNDTQAPVLAACPANINQTIPGTTATINYTPPTATDNCPGVTVACVPPSGASFPVGTTTVTCRATDAAGNQSPACSFTVQLTTGSNPFVPAPTQTLRPADPLLCLGAGSLVRGEFGVTNTSAIAQTGTLTTQLPAQLIPLAGSCTVNTGACAFISANTAVQWSGTLAPGQTVTVSYLAQVADDTPNGAQLCAVTTALFPPGNPVSVTACVTTNCPPVGPGAPPNVNSPVSDQRAGSVLVFNLYTSSASNANTQNTRLSLTNTDSSRAAFVHLFFVDGATCSVADSYICLTPNQTTSFLASDVDPGTTGYLVAVAVDARGCPISFNHLIGDAFVKLTSGHAANLGAEAFAALAGGLPACSDASPVAELRFDGVSYNRAPRVLALSNLGSRADGNDTLLVLNRLGGNLATGAATLTNLFGVLYDDAEQPFSFSFSPGTCQFRSVLSSSFPRTAPRLEQVIPAGRSGWLKLASQNDQALLGAALNFNANATTQGNAFNQGHNLHKLTLTQGVALTIPVFPPNC